MDISILVPAVQELFEAGIANSTQRVYKAGDKRYNDFCNTFRLAPYPVTETQLSYFVAYLFKEGLSAATVKSYLAAVRHSQIARGLGNPHINEMPRLEYIVKGLKRKAINSNARPRLPMTPEILKAMKEVWRIDSDRNKATMLWAAACTCFFGFLRSGEVVVPSDSEYDATVHLSFGDVRLDNTTDPQFLEVTIKASKTDPFRQGVQVYLGRTNTDLCPVAAVLSYMVYRGTDSGPFFRYTRIRALTRERFVGDVRSALQAAGIDWERYSGHSFRIGAASTAARCGLQDSLIKTLGRWESMAYSLYIRTPRETLCTVSRLLVTCRNEKPVSITTS